MTRAPLHRLRRPWHPDPVGEAAAAWILLQDEGELSETDQRRLAEWLAEDEAHVAAYEDALWALDATARHAGEPEMLALRSAALSARSPRRRYWGWTAGLGSIAAAAAGLLLWAGPVDQRTPAASPTKVAERATDPKTNYRTGIGERSAINLPDGSVATLDTDSQIRVAYSNGERAIYLLKGQALFEVAHGRPAPFQVYAAGQRITAVGTIFNVRLDGSQVRVSMVEGRVRVRPATSAGSSERAPVKEISLSAGEAVVTAPARPLLVTPVQARDVTAWKGGQIVFNDVSLAAAVAEVNRYTASPILVADPQARGLRVSGVFTTNDPGYFADAMAEILPVEVTRGSNGAPVLRSQSD